MLEDRMSTTSVQLSGKQFNNLKQIRKAEDARSNAEVLRNAFDFYVEAKYPELCVD